MTDPPLSLPLQLPYLYIQVCAKSTGVNFLFIGSWAQFLTPNFLSAGSKSHEKEAKLFIELCGPQR
jgi:hypothetical protein